MSIRTHEFVPNSILTAAQMNDVKSNGVIQVDTTADLNDASLAGANVAFVVEEMKMYQRIADGIGGENWEAFSGTGGGSSWGSVDSAPDAVSGSYYDTSGAQWAYYEFNTPGTFDIELSGGIYWVLAVGGGGGGIDSSTGHLQQGQPGSVSEGLWEFQPGTQTVTVGARGATNQDVPQGGAGRPSSIGDYGTQGISSWGSCQTGRGAVLADVVTGYKSRITGDELEYATGYIGEDRPGRGGYNGGEQRDGTVIIACRLDQPTLAPVPPRLESAPIVSAPVSISGPAVQEWLVRDKQGNRKVVYFLPGNTGTARSLALTEEGQATLEARKELLETIATTDVPEDFDGDPVTLLPKKLRAELRGFVEVRATPQPEAVYSVTLGAGVLPGVMVGGGGQGGNQGAGGAGGVIGTGAHIPVILPVQGTATYTVTVASTNFSTDNVHTRPGFSTSIAVQGQEPFAVAIGGGDGVGKNTSAISGGQGASGGGAGEWSTQGAAGSEFWGQGAPGIPGYGHNGAAHEGGHYGGGGGYGSRGGEGGYAGNGGKGFDLATALNLDANDGLTGTFLDQVSVDGFIAGGGAVGAAGVAVGGGGISTGAAGSGGHAKAYTGSGGGGQKPSGSGGATGGCGAVYIITDPPA